MKTREVIHTRPNQNVDVPWALKLGNSLSQPGKHSTSYFHPWMNFRHEIVSGPSWVNGKTGSGCDLWKVYFCQCYEHFSVNFGFKKCNITLKKITKNKLRRESKNASDTLQSIYLAILKWLIQSYWALRFSCTNAKRKCLNSLFTWLPWQRN